MGYELVMLVRRELVAHDADQDPIEFGRLHEFPHGFVQPAQLLCPELVKALGVVVLINQGFVRIQFLGVASLRVGDGEVVRQ